MQARVGLRSVEGDVHDACFFCLELCGRERVAEGVQVCLAAVGAVRGVVEEEVRVVDLDGVLVWVEGEGNVCVDGFFLRVEFPQVRDG